MDPQQADPKGLIRESYRIDGITDAECRSILIDWALSLPAGAAQSDAIDALLAHYGTEAPDHPMTALLREGQSPGTPTRRRGGRAARVSGG
ncbi:hypothetical protein HUK65_04585 [Rhodobacteraceae bacterium 2376]|uniref:Uncharacterized protein n=1 Tax=Rhabdonatronobacter sediminivivens TaxID=2743469 RepID=A0A7Z0KWQ2_9RHOB|nr:hypothetical protein [Rhabdonatronobacter sediminivivens]NYS24262.1 hypothetical protein [Rhabdonatronobacter sediminivivens]